LINGQVAGMDAFGRPDTFSKVFRKLLESYALDNIDWCETDGEHKALKSEEANEFEQLSAVSPNHIPSFKPIEKEDLEWSMNAQEPCCSN